MNISKEGNFYSLSGFPFKIFFHALQKKYNTKNLSKIFNIQFKLFSGKNVILHEFFLPEFYYLLQLFPNSYSCREASRLLLNYSWLHSTNKQFPSIINYLKINNDFKENYRLKDYQHEFLDLYNQKKQQYRLNGYILSFEQGLGKTITSINLMHGLEKDNIIIIAPKSTIRTVWENEINKIFKEKQNIWVIGDPVKKAKFYIVNYESMDKIHSILKFITPNSKSGIIVDESHNFRNVNTKRVDDLSKIASYLHCDDILLMSGTPIKAMGSEMIPTLKLLDNFFDNYAEDKFKKVFGLNRDVALDILKNRLGLMMHRKLKAEVLNLPQKHEEYIKIKIKNPDKYLIKNVKNQALEFIHERQYYYRNNYKYYENDYMICIKYLSDHLREDLNFLRYLKIINYLKNNGYNRQDSRLVEDVAWANKYEKEIRLLLPNELKRKFDKSKAVVKYVDLKIMGEFLGLLNNIRSEMFSQMLQNSPIHNIIQNADKKTICFTSYTDVVETTEEYLKQKYHLRPISIYGETSKDISSLLKDFKTNAFVNPLIATIQSLSTGVTLIEANTVIFLNQPWRHTDRLQAEDRVHRIGQDSDVFVKIFILDTGSEPNLSTRMEDIISWSKTQFEGIVGTESGMEVKNIIRKLIK